jgi:hypothetical protein
MGMPRVLYGNFDFEHELTTTGYNRTRKFERLNAEMSTHLLALANDGDLLFYPGDAPQEFLADAAVAGFSEVHAIERDSQATSTAELHPWGWSRRAIDFATSRNWSFDAPPAEAVARLNSREFSFDLERRQNMAIPGTVPVDSLDCLEEAILLAAELWNCQKANFNWLLKAEFGMSGRERVSGRGPELDDSQANWIRRRLKSDGRLYFEPRVESLGEFSTQWSIDDTDFSVRGMVEPELVGTTQLLVDHSGQYVGSILADRSLVEAPMVDDADDNLTQELLGQVLRSASSVAEIAVQLGYRGPLGVDSMVYSGPDGEPALRSVQDVNARFTMGRIALEWFRRFATSDRPAWLLVPSEWLNDGGELASVTNPVRRLTSPHFVAGQAVRRVGVLIDDQNAWQNLLATHLRP